MKFVHYLKHLRFGIFYRLLTKRGIPLVTLGKVCQWTFHDTALNSTSRVLCAGAGGDISFEKAITARYGCKAILLDPSPTGTATVRRENIPNGRLQHLATGLAGEDGVLSFQAPVDAVEGSFRKGPDDSAGAVQFECKSLSTLMSELNWQQIDLLKIDIEGSEYGAIKDLLRRNLKVKQLCVEFHYAAGFGHTRMEMIRCILALRKAGYELIYHIHYDHTFLHRSCGK
jgi:FkbM family methyltransferase